MKYREPTIQDFLASIPGKIRFVNYATGCDFGGTKERFVLYGLSNQKTIHPLIRVHWFTADNVPMAAMIDAYRQILKAYRYDMPKQACFGLAGPIEANGRICRLTNSEKTISVSELKKLGITAFLYNDFFVNIAAIPVLAKSYSDRLEHAVPTDRKHSSNQVIAIGPGSGMGVGLGEYSDNRFCLRASEGGHTLYGPTGKIEDRLLTFIRDTITKGKPVEVEQIASGIGISYIFRFLAGQRPFSTLKSFTKLMQNTKSQPPQIAGRMIIDAYNNGFAELEIGLKIFVEASALTAINQVQTMAAYGGKVFILGGNARRTLPLFEKYFMPVFDNPYIHADKLRATSVYVVKKKNIGTLGAASLILRSDLYRF
jgi:glucokinase